MAVVDGNVSEAIQLNEGRQLAEVIGTHENLCVEILGEEALKKRKAGPSPPKRRGVRDDNYAGLDMGN
jgi:hypothetical protein